MDRKKLLEKLSKGDVHAFNRIYKDYYARIFGFVHHTISSREDAEEIVQEVFIKIWDKKSDIDPEKSFNSYIYTISKNSIHDYLRRVLRERKYIEEIITEFSLIDNQLEDIVNYRETEKVIKQLIEKLPPKRKEAFELSRFSNKTYREISSIMNISENTVDTHIRKSLAWLREGLIQLSSFLAIVTFKM